MADSDEILCWKKRLELALKDGLGEPYDLQLRHMDRLQITGLTEMEALFSVLRRPSLFSKDRMSLYTAACLPTLQRYCFDFQHNQLRLIEEIPGEAEINWDFLISEEVSQLRHEGVVDRIAQALSALDPPDVLLIQQAVSAELAKINYLRIMQEMGIAHETARGLAQTICQRLVPRLIAEITADR